MSVCKHSKYVLKAVQQRARRVLVVRGNRMIFSHIQRTLWMFILVQVGEGQSVSWKTDVESLCTGQLPICSGDIVLSIEAQQWSQTFAANITFLAGLQ